MNAHLAVMVKENVFSLLYIFGPNDQLPYFMPEYEHNIQNILPISGSSASLPIKSTTLVAGSSRTGPICSVGLCTVGSPGAIPGHVSDCSNCHKVIYYVYSYLQVTPLYIFFICGTFNSVNLWAFIATYTGTPSLVKYFDLENLFLFTSEFVPMGI